MAGGIDWFRWHHGSVNDQKFPLIARRAGASVAEVIAVWANLLERASQCDERGTLGSMPDFESMDCAMGMEDGRCARIFAAMQDKGMVINGLTLEAWARRQPKKEDDGAAERKRQQREREAAEKAAREAAAITEAERDKQRRHDASRDVTLEKSREEKSREEEGSENTQPGATAAGAVCVLLRSKRIATVNPGHLGLKALLDAGVDIGAFAAAADIAINAGHPSFEYVLGIVRRQEDDSQRMAANARASPQPQSRADRQLETAALLTGARRPQPKPVETIDVESRILPA